MCEKGYLFFMLPYLWSTHMSDKGLLYVCFFRRSGSGVFRFRFFTDFFVCLFFYTCDTTIYWGSGGLLIVLVRVKLFQNSKEQKSNDLIQGIKFHTAENKVKHVIPNCFDLNLWKKIIHKTAPTNSTFDLILWDFKRWNWSLSGLFNLEILFREKKNIFKRWNFESLTCAHGVWWTILFLTWPVPINLILSFVVVRYSFLTYIPSLHHNVYHHHSHSALIPFFHSFSTWRDMYDKTWITWAEKMTTSKSHPANI